MPRLRWGPSAFAVSVIALFMSLGGTGYALTEAGGSPPASQSATHTQLKSATSAAPLPRWHRLTLRNGWQYGTFGSYHAAYYKDSGHVVHLRGSASNGDPTSAVFRLPRSARPSHQIWLPVYALDGSTGGLNILPNGQAFLFDTSGNNSNVTGYSSFDGVSFRVP